MLMQDTGTAHASRLDAFLEGKAPAQRAAILGLRFREPRTMDEWRLWVELQIEFARWGQPEQSLDAQ